MLTINEVQALSPEAYKEYQKKVYRSAVVNITLFVAVKLSILLLLRAWAKAYRKSLQN